jgi:bifunctional non-homologous end joining protein LigD
MFNLNRRATTGSSVTFAYGRRGSTMSTGSKTSSPVDYDEAKRVYDNLVREKTAKGYTPGTDGTPYVRRQQRQAALGLGCRSC